MRKTYFKNTVSLDELTKDFTAEQWRIVAEERQSYELLLKFRQERRKQKMSQANLSKKAKINRTTLSRVENGIRNATVDTLSKIALALNMKLEIQLKPLRQV